MRWNDQAIILSVRKHGETSAVVRVLARAHGVFGGVIKGASGKAQRGILQPGNVVNAAWNARLSEHLGMFKCELLEAHAAHLMSDAAKLAALSSACALVESALPERHPYPKLYEGLRELLDALRSGDEWPLAYVRFELQLLAESGFGLDLSRCAATGTTEDLVYVSPKSGRAVSKEAGEPYKERLLELPHFLLPSLPKKALSAPSPRRGEGWGGGGLSTRSDHASHVLIPNARKLRKDSTDAERHLWYYLRAHRFYNHGFRRQHPLSKKYIADLVCLDKKLIIELDGGQHSEQQQYDAKRTAFLEAEGYRVLRFWNNEIFENMEGVLMAIADALGCGETTPSPTLPPPGGGGSKETLAGLRLSGYFLEHWLLSPHNRKLPAARGRLMEMMRETHARETAEA